MSSGGSTLNYTLGESPSERSFHLMNFVSFFLMFYYNNISERETYISQLHESRGVTDFSPLIPLEY